MGVGSNHDHHRLVERQDDHLVALLEKIFTHVH